MSDRDKIKVIIRLRPLIEREKNDGVNWKSNSSEIFQVDPANGRRLKNGSSFNFDCVMDHRSSNYDVYDACASPIVEGATTGFNGTIFAYGQTSSGKTHTITGNDSDPGIVLRAIDQIFSSFENFPDREFILRASCMEIYNENLYDLLSDKGNSPRIREDPSGRVYVQDLTEECLVSRENAAQLFEKGFGRRRTAGTKMNDRSSRSHAIFRMIIESRERSNDGDRRVSTDGGVFEAHLNIVDLAGSERADQSGAQGERLKEAANINKSLFTLTQVISKLSKGDGQFVGFRDSQLTRILQNSLGGNSRTAIICNVTPAQIPETLSTLNFAGNAKKIQNKPVKNEILSEDAMLRRMQKEIQAKNKLIDELRGGTGVAEMERLIQEKEDTINQLKKQLICGSRPAAKEKVPNRRETWAGSHEMFQKTPDWRRTVPRQKSVADQTAQQEKLLFERENVDVFAVAEGDGHENAELTSMKEVDADGFVVSLAASSGSASSKAKRRPAAATVPKVLEAVDEEGEESSPPVLTSQQKIPSPAEIVQQYAVDTETESQLREAEALLKQSLSTTLSAEAINSLSLVELIQSVISSRSSNAPEPDVLVSQQPVEATENGQLVVSISVEPDHMALQPNVNERANVCKADCSTQVTPLPSRSSPFPCADHQNSAQNSPFALYSGDTSMADIQKECKPDFSALHISMDTTMSDATPGRLKAMVVEKEKDMVEMSSLCERLMCDRAALDAKVKQLQKENTLLDQRLSHAAQERQEEIDELKKGERRVEAELKALSGFHKLEHQCLTDELELLKARLEKVENSDNQQTSDLQTALVMERANVDAVELELARMKKRAENAEKDLKDYEWVLETERKKHARESATLKEQVSQIQLASQGSPVAANNEVDIKALQEQIETLTAQQTSFNEEITRLKSDLEDSITTNIATQEDLRRHQEQLGERERKIINLENELATLKMDMEETASNAPKPANVSVDLAAMLEVEVAEKMTLLEFEQKLEFEGKVNVHRTEYDQLREQVTTLESCVQGLRTENASLIERLQNAKALLADEQAKLVSVVEQHAAEVAQATAHAVAEFRTSSALQDENIVAVSDKDIQTSAEEQAPCDLVARDYSEDLERMSVQTAQKEELTKQFCQLEQLSMRLKELQSEANVRSEQLNAANEKLKLAEDFVTSLTNKNSALEETISKHAAQLLTLQGELKAKEAFNKNLSASHSAIELRLAATTEELMEYRRVQKELLTSGEVAVSEKEATIRSLNEKINSLESSSNARTRELQLVIETLQKSQVTAACSGSGGGEQQKITSLKNEVEQLRRQLTAVELQLKEEQERNGDSASKAVEALKKELALKNRELEIALSKKRRVETICDEVEADWRKAEKLVEEREAENVALKTQLEKLQCEQQCGGEKPAELAAGLAFKLKRREVQIHELQQQLCTMQKELETSRRQRLEEKNRIGGISVPQQGQQHNGEDVRRVLIEKEQQIQTLKTKVITVKEPLEKRIKELEEEAKFQEDKIRQLKIQLRALQEQQRDDTMVLQKSSATSTSSGSASASTKYFSHPESATGSGIIDHFKLYTLEGEKLKLEKNLDHALKEIKVLKSKIANLESQLAANNTFVEKENQPSSSQSFKPISENSAASAMCDSDSAATGTTLRKPARYFLEDLLNSENNSSAACSIRSPSAERKQPRHATNHQLKRLKTPPQSSKLTPNRYFKPPSDMFPDLNLTAETEEMRAECKQQ